MKSKTIIANIEWTGNEHIDNPESVEIELSPKDMILIKKCREFLKENPEVSDLRIDVYVTQFLDDEGDNMDFASDVNKLVISSDSVHYYGQHKYDSTAQLESEDFNDKI